MPESLEERDSAVVSSAGEPGPLSRLLQELADASGEDALDAWKSELQPGDRVGRFEIRREVGRGGFGTVYEAFDTELSRVVAVKRLRLSRPRKDLSADWIKKEAEAVARLDHPCIVTLFDVGTCDSGPYLVMELLRGQTLAQRIAAGAMPQVEALRIAGEMASGLAHAHQRGVLHRDLKPANVFLCEDGRVKILDFGLAHLLGKSGSQGSGTPGYMPPEQERGDEIDARADVYAAAVTLREMLTGQRVAAGNHSIPRALLRPLERALSPNRDERPRDGTAWRDELLGVQRALEKPRRIRRVVGLVLGGLVVGGVFAGIVMERRRSAPVPPLAERGDGRITVAVADFANETRDPDLDALSGLLITSLEQSHVLSVLPRGRMLDLARQAGASDVDRIDEVVGHRAAREGGAQAFLVAAVHRFGERYTVLLRATDPVRDRSLFALKATATSKSAVPDLIDELGEKARLALHEPKEEVAAAQSKVGTGLKGNLEAYRYYFLGQQHADRFDYPAALAQYRKALEIDPELALAHFGIAMIGFMGGPVPDTGQRYQDAIRLADDLPEKERLLVRAASATASGRPEEARKSYDLLVDRFGNDKRVLFQAAVACLAYDDPAGARALYERAYRLDPDFMPVLLLLQEGMIGEGREAEAEALLKAAVVRAPTSDKWALLAGIQLYSGKAQQAHESALQSVQLDGGVDRRGVLHGSLVALERWDEAGEVLQRAIAGGETERLQVTLAAFHRLTGRRRTAWQDLDRAEADGMGGAALRARALLEAGDGRGPTLEMLSSADWDARAKRGYRDLLSVPVALSLSGDFQGVKRFRDELQAVGAHLGMYKGAFPLVGSLADGLFAQSRGDFARAREELGRVAASHDQEVRGLGLYTLGAACFEAGDDACAVPALEEFLRRTTSTFRTPWRAWAYPRVLYLLSRISERSGRRDRALDYVDRLLGLWKEADPDLPLLAEAKAARVRLAAR